MLAEGAAVLILEDLEHALARKATVYAELMGAASTCDGYDMIHSHTNGVEAARAIATSLEYAGLTPAEIDIVFTHAPGSRDADALEINALKQIFRSSLKDVFIANIKSMIGYPQGATTALECAAACLCLLHGFVPPVLNTVNPEVLLNISREARSANLKRALINCFGFGGKNVCLVLRRSN